MTADDLVDQMDRDRVGAARRCRVCKEFSPVARKVVELGRERGHPYEAISRKLREKFSIDVHPSVLRNHMVRHV